VRNRVAKRQVVEQFPAGQIIIRRGKIAKPFCAKNKLCARRKNRLQNAPMSRPRLIALLLALGTLLAYMPAANHGFTLYDDGDYVTENRVVQNGVTWAGIKWAFTTWHASNWHPLTWISHMIDCQLAGLNPTVPHCENILFHVANTILLFALLLRLTNLIWPSAFVAALFAWHPLHVESVAWIAERKDVLSTFFALLSLLSYAKYAKGNCRRSFWFALVFFALGLLAKPMLVTLPFVLLLLDYWPLKRFPASDFRFPVFLRLALEKWPFFLLVTGSCVLTFLAQHNGGAVASLQNVPLDYRLYDFPLAYMRYLQKIFWPENLCVFYPLPEIISPLATAAAAAVLISISAAVWFARKHSPYWIVGWLWFLGTLVPVIGLVQVGSAAMADRYSYFPAVGLFLAAAMGFRDAAEKFQVSKKIIAMSAGLILAICLALTHNQLNYWRDDISLFSRAIAVTAHNETGHLNLGVALEKAGRKTEAMAEYRKALQIEPKHADTHNNLANLLDDSGHPDEAQAEYLTALQIDPHYVAAHNNFGTLLVKLGRFDEAMKHYAEAVRLDPSDWHAPFLEGKALLKEGHDAEAIPFFQQAVKIDPDNLHILTYLAQVLASDQNLKIRNGQVALALAAKANDLSGGYQPVMIDAMAMAYAEIGQFDEARQAEESAVKLATALDMTNDLPDIRQRLQLYQNNQPFRQSFINSPEK
jgi:tetratricopeptide (TPR) repeat protein